MRRTPPTQRTRRERGAALLMAMLTVTLVATFAATALWQQWRAVEVEAAERYRAQSSWVLVGALDWARLILRQDAMPGSGNTSGTGVDHLGEPWAVPLQETRMSTFIAADKGVSDGDTEDLPDLFLSGRIIDLQSRLNINSLTSENGEPVPAVQEAFVRLFELLNLPQAELQRLTEGLRLARTDAALGDTEAPLLPKRFDQLVWLGVSPATLQALAPHVTVLPGNTTVNLNTASAEVIAASVPQGDLVGAQRLVAARASRHLSSVAEAGTLMGLDAPLNATNLSVKSDYFEVQGRLRGEGGVVNERSLVRRSFNVVTTIWRERTAGELPP
jgi:general secretion pathway protein K